MTSIDSVTLEVADPTAAERFYADAFGLGASCACGPRRSRRAGFRGFTLSLTVSQPATRQRPHRRRPQGRRDELKPAAKSLWGYGGVVQAPDGTIWKIATSARKDSGPATRQIDQLVLLIGCEDVAASKQFYVDHGLAVGKSFGRKYVEFAIPSSPVKFGLYGHKALAKRRRPGRGHRIAPPDHRQRRRIVHRPGRVRVGDRELTPDAGPGGPDSPSCGRCGGRYPGARRRCG